MQNGVACPDSYYRKAIAEYTREVSSLSDFNRLPRWRSAVIAASRMHRRDLRHAKMWRNCETRF